VAGIANGKVADHFIIGLGWRDGKKARADGSFRSQPRSDADSVTKTPDFAFIAITPEALSVAEGKTRVRKENPDGSRN